MSEAQNPPDLTVWTQSVVQGQTTEKRIGRPRVRPSCDDAEAVQRLCDAISEGISIHTACRGDHTLPSARDVFRRLASDATFGAAIARAREAQQDAYVDRMVDLADNATPENVNVVKLQIWTAQWTASKLASKKYGDRTELNVNITHGLADRLNAAIARQTEKLIEGKAEPEDSDGSE